MIIISLIMTITMFRVANAFLSSRATSVYSHAISKQQLCMSSNDDISYKVAFMFPGQGAQTVGMGKAVCDELPAAKEVYNNNYLAFFTI